ncbi:MULTISPECIES: hypothetical protein [unclassified Variovorax]|uniref:hypothetical protein n=1 Tax=unclassified Variovorax TaxID=663243 RepID=UPI0032E624C7
MKRASLLLSVAALQTVLWTVPTTAWAASLTFLNGAIVTRIPSKDLPAFRTAVGDVLNKSADGTTTQWSSTYHSPRRTPVRVEITPIQSAQTQTARTCRLLDARVSQLKSSEKWQFWFCKQDDGSWKSSGSNVPR